MKKPLAENYCVKSAKSVVESVVGEGEGASTSTVAAQSDVSPTGNKENARSAEAPQQSEPARGKRKEVKNNAFARLMTAAKKKGVWEQEEQDQEQGGRRLRYNGSSYIRVRQQRCQARGQKV